MMAKAFGAEIDPRGDGVEPSSNVPSGDLTKAFTSCFGFPAPGHIIPQRVVTVGLNPTDEISVPH